MSEPSRGSPRGLQLAIATGDRERLVAQMSDLRRESLAALGRELDELEARADEFLTQPQPPKPAWQPRKLPGVLAALDAAQGSALAPTAAVPATKSSGDRVVLALSWFPREEFDAVLEAWPQLADGWCARTGNDPASGSARSRYAAELARTASDELIAWPPARNAPCWCDSGRKSQVQAVLRRPQRRGDTCGA